MAPLLIGIIVGVIGVVLTAWFNGQQNERQNKLEDRRAASEREVEEQRAQDEALQLYLDQMSTLLLDEDLRNPGADGEVLTLARARTATVIQRLDAEGNRNVVRFLSEASLTGGDGSSISLLAGTDLRGALLKDVDLSAVDLSDANLEDANLNGADLSDAKLSGAQLIRADLSHADLEDADLSGAGLSRANLSDSALLSVDLSNANLFEAILKNANLSGANLEGAILRGAGLSGANLDGIFQDDFSDTSSGWPVHKFSAKEPYVQEYVAGRYRIRDAESDSQRSALNPGAVTEIEDAVVEVDATVSGNAPQSDDDEWGLVCRAVDNANYYTLGINADGRPTIWKLKDDDWTELRTGSPSDAVRLGTDKNHLRADCVGDKLTLYVNDRRVLQAEDSDFESGQVGLVAEQYGEAIDVSFDDFVINIP
jgi:uncharacterized protein YjbI with pentapeptide repeats